MSFSGTTTITQSGTDTTATFLSYMSGLGDTVAGGVITGAARTVYVTGTLTLQDIYTEDIAFELAPGATLQFGVEDAATLVTSGGCHAVIKHNHSGRMALGCDQSGTRSVCKIFDSHIKIDSSSRTDLGFWDSPRNTQFVLNGAVIERLGTGDCSFYAAYGIVRGAGTKLLNLHRVFQNPISVDVTGPVQIDGGSQGISCLSADGLLLSDVTLQNVTYDFTTKYYVSAIRGDLSKTNIWWNNASGGDRRADPYYKKLRGINHVVRDSSGSPISGVKVHVRDATPAYGPDESGVYGSVTSTTSAYGVPTAGELLIRDWTALFSDDIYSLVSGDNYEPVTSAAITDNGPHFIFIGKYGYEINAKTYAVGALRDFGYPTLPEPVILEDDADITEPSEAVVLAYTTIDTEDEFYDRYVSYICTNIASIGEHPVSKVAGGIDLGDWDLDIDASAASAFAMAGGKITIKSSSFSGNITTTGTVTLKNGAVATGAITDSGGTDVPVSITVLDESGAPIEGAAVRLTKTTGGAEVLNTETDASGIGYGRLTDTFPLSITGWVRSGSGPVPYNESQVTGSVTTSGFTQTVILSEDI